MKRIPLWLFVTAMLMLVMPSTRANNLKPAPQPKTAWAVSMRTIKAFDQYTTLLAKAKHLTTYATKTALTNSSMTNSRPDNYTMIIPVFAIDHGGTTDYYYTDNCPNGATVNFDVPDIASVTHIRLYQLGDNFWNWEWAPLYTNNGSTYESGEADPNGQNWIDFWNGEGPWNIINGIDVTVY